MFCNRTSMTCVQSNWGYPGQLRVLQYQTCALASLAWFTFGTGLPGRLHILQDQARAR